MGYFAKNQSIGQPKVELNQEIKERIVSGGNYRDKINKNKSIIDEILPNETKAQSHQNSANKLQK